MTIIAERRRLRHLRKGKMEQNAAKGVDASYAPILAITMGDPAGVGPEIIAGAWSDFFETGRVRSASAAPLPKTRPFIFGDPAMIARGAKIRGVELKIIPIEAKDVANAAKDYDAIASSAVAPVVPCCDPDVASVEIGEITPQGGDAAFRSLNRAIDLALAREVDAIVTAPLHKESLNLAGHKYPGHTEILAERCRVKDFGMALYLGANQALKSPTGLGVVHVTLHMAMREAVDALTPRGVFEKIGLMRRFMSTILDRDPKIGVCALNCHAGDGGLFGDEEIRIIAPAVRRAQRAGVVVAGPYPSDTLFLDAKNGLYDGIVAMYHDQGHIAVKMLDMFAAVNVALGLPIIRSSVAHGTAFNIAGKGIATTKSLLEAARVAALFARKGETP